MKANELRIGNWINDALEGISQIGCIDTRSQNVGLINPLGGSHDGTMLEFIQPILLTKEWLLKLGFDHDGYNEYTKGSLLLDNEYTDKGEWVVILKGVDITPVESKNKYVCYYYPTKEIKYVHQLQNLYFALTGEELVYEKS